ncbi:MAG: GNAT family N-acetyltransferase [Pseudomonadales bacterium]
MKGLTIRPESPTDFAAIRELTLRAFSGMPYSDGDEHELIDELRARKALSISLVAERDGLVVGHIAFSPAYPEDGTPGWYALGPVSVLPKDQLQGIGTALINTGLTSLKDFAGIGCILTGNPDYYRRFGFSLSPDNVPPGESEEYFMVNTLGSVTPTGPIRFHGAFHGG